MCFAAAETWRDVLRRRRRPTPAADSHAGEDSVPLDTYRTKRDFERSPEPRGEEAPRRSDRRGLQFVVQKHAATRLHYDFRLEMEGVLKSWAVPKGPSLDPSERRLAMRTEDHPLEYGEFEGVIPEGEYGGGTVLVWDRGYWVPEQEDPSAALRAGRLDFRLEGEKLRGGWRLIRMEGREGDDSERESWLLMKRRDGEAAAPGAAPLVERRPGSVLTGRKLDEVASDRDRIWHSDGGEEGGGRAESPPGDPGALPGARQADLPEDPRPQLATLVSEAPSGAGWLHEIKLDGYRLLCRISRGTTRLLTRRGNDWTERFPEVAAAAARLPCETALLDGEAVVLDRRGISDFQALQNAIGSGGAEIRYVAFDLLHLDGWDLTEVPLRARKDALRLLLAAAGGDGVVRYGDHVEGAGELFFDQACDLQVEGIVSKRADAPYRARRTRDWRKVKCVRRQEFVVVGFTEPAGSRVGLGALVLGAHETDGRLTHAGKVGTGFTEAKLRELRRRLEPLERPESPLANPPRGAEARGIRWVEPRLLAEVQFAELTGGGVVRHASFQGVREDKDPEEVVREEPGGAARARRAGRRRGPGPARVAGVRLTNPDRVLWPEQGVTKRELAAYYEAVADRILPELAERPLTLLRCPSGHHEGCFYQKHANETISETIPRVSVREEGEEEAEPYMYVDGLPALISLVQLGVLELHVWGSRVDRLDRPDRLVFDLDPGPGVAWEEVATAGLALRDRLEELGLRTFAKGTGGKGLHVVAPLVRRSGWDEAKAFARAVAEEFARRDPERYTARLAKRERQGRVFIDYLRNARNATAIAPFSARARPGAPVATPLFWKTVEASAAGEPPPRPTVRELPEALAAGPDDPWAEMSGQRQSITVAMRRALDLDRRRR